MTKLYLSEDKVRVVNADAGNIVNEFDKYEDAEKFINESKDTNYKILESLLREDLDYSVIADKLLNKPVTYKEKEYIVTDADNEDDNVILTITAEDGEERVLSANTVFEKGLLNSEDEDVKEVISMYETESESEEVISSEEELSEMTETERGIADARADFFAKPRKMDTFRKLDKDPYKYNFTEYEEAYYSEFLRLRKSPSARMKTHLKQTIEHTYKGDVDELIAWLRDAITSITINDSPSTRDDIARFLAELGSSYEPTHSNNKEGSEFTANITNKKEILDRMPKEVLTWQAYKNAGTLGSKSQKELTNVYVEKDHKITSNDLVKDLILNYGFKPGENKPVTEDLEELSDVIVDTPVIEEPTKEEVDNGMFTVISQEIRDTYQDIENLKSIITTIKDLDNKEEVIATLESIIDDRTIHIGTLQTLLDSFDKDTSELIDKGAELVLEEPKEEEVVDN